MGEKIKNSLILLMIINFFVDFLLFWELIFNLKEEWELYLKVFKLFSVGIECCCFSWVFNDVVVLKVMLFKCK